MGTQVIEEKAEEEEVSTVNIDMNLITNTENSSINEADVSEEICISKKAINASLIHMKMRKTPNMM